MPIFGNNDDQTQNPAAMADQTPVEENISSATPTDKVIAMRQQGLSNNQIIGVLQKDGHETPDIFNALSQADMKANVENSQPQQPAGLQNPMQMNPSGDDSQMPFYAQPMENDQGQSLQQPGPLTGGPVQQNIPPNQQQPMPEPQPTPMGNPGPMGPPTMGPSPMEQPMPMGGSGNRERIEELAEAIIDEKWNEIVKSINKIIDWKDRVESRITKMEQRLDDMNKNFESLHKGVLGKVNEYDKNLNNIGTEIKAMEKVFQKVLPTMTENISELSRITDKMKEKK